MRLLLALLLTLASAASASAFTCNDSGCSFTISYNEPTTLSNGDPLVDLASTTSSYTVSVDGGPASAPKTTVSPASSLGGGGKITQEITDPTLLPGHVYTIVATAAASNAAGDSVASTPGDLVINRKPAVKPSRPNSLSVE